MPQGGRGPSSQEPDDVHALPLDPDLDPDVDPDLDAVDAVAEVAVRSRWPRLRGAVLGAVFCGGCVGGLGRYEVTRAWPTPEHGFPWSTLLVNSSGAFVLALLLVLIADVLPPTTYVRPLLGTGFCGAWTTFSAVTVSAVELIAHHHPGTGVMYVLASIVGGLASAALGLAVGRSLAASRDGGTRAFARRNADEEGAG